MQLTLDLIPHETRGFIIHQRPKDGYINATAMCRAASRPWSRYWELPASKEFAEALSAALGIPRAELIQSLVGGQPHLQGTWVHPRIAIHLAQWLSPEFAVQVSGWVFDWMSGKTPAQARPELPYHLRRYIANQSAVPVGHFSILAEMITLLIGPMEAMGYTLPENMLPDISMGRMFCKWLREAHGLDTDSLPTYWHAYEDGRRIQAKAYPEELLHHFRRHFRDEWFPRHAAEYFRKRDSEALEYLPRLLMRPKPH